MRKNLLVALLLSLSSVVLAQPIANFNFTNACLGSASTFTDASSGASTWDWNFGDSGTSTQQNPTHTYSNPGNYTVQLVAGNAGVYDTIQQVITIFPNPIVNVISDQAICLGSSTTLSASGGTTYSWSPTTGLSSPTVANPVASPTSTTTYTVTVIDVNSCIANDMVNVTVNQLPIINYTSHTQCEDGGGIATINLTNMDNYISGGLNMVDWYTDAGYTSWISDPTSFSTDSTILYTKITDGNGCENTNIVEINVPINNIVASPSTTNASCNGMCDGSIFLTPSGGTTPYTYFWSPGGNTTQNITNLCAGTYTYTITDANGCINFDDVIVSEPSAIFLSDVVTNVSCNGGSDGSINITPIGGQTPYAYSWSPIGATTAVVTGLAAGTYTVTVTDANGCTEVLNSMVTEPSPIFITFTTVSDVTCYGANDGYININVNGGTIGYSYLWSNAETSLNISNLSGGTYSVTVTDANGCTAIDGVSLTEPSPSGVIKGIVNFQSVHVTAGNVDLIKKNGNTPADIQTQSTLSMDTSGTFIFSNLYPGTYLLKALGDTFIYNNVATYADNTNQWQLATEYNTTGCPGDTVNGVIIDLIELPANSGPGTINGRLVEGGGVFNKAPGEPIPDIDITVDQSPGGSVMAAATTDINGYFTITDLPIGTYTIYADMHGYGVTLQTIDINSTTPSYDVVLCSDTLIDMIDMCEMTVTSVKKVNTINNLKIYPNPAKNTVNIVYNGSEALNLEVTDITGKKVMSQTLKTKTIDVSGLTNGLYFVRLYNQNDDFIQKLVIE